MCLLANSIATELKRQLVINISAKIFIIVEHLNSLILNDKCLRKSNNISLFFDTYLLSYVKQHFASTNASSCSL